MSSSGVAPRTARCAAQTPARQHRAGGSCAGGDRSRNGSLLPLLKGLETDGSPMTRPHGAWADQPGARRSPRRAGGRVRRRDPLGPGVVRAVRNGRGPFGDAETLSKAKDTGINGLQEAGIVQAGPARSVLNRARLDRRTGIRRHAPRLTVWELTQHLIRALEPEAMRRAESCARSARWPRPPRTSLTASTRFANARSGPRRRWPTTCWSNPGLNCPEVPQARNAKPENFTNHNLFVSSDGSVQGAPRPKRLMKYSIRAY